MDPGHDLGPGRHPQGGGLIDVAGPAADLAAGGGRRRGAAGMRGSATLSGPRT